MVDVMGSGYVVDHCVSEYNRRQKQLSFEVYITDAAAALINVWSKGDYPRYYDLIHPKQEDKRSGSEIADDIIKRHGLKVVD